MPRHRAIDIICDHLDAEVTPEDSVIRAVDKLIDTIAPDEYDTATGDIIRGQYLGRVANSVRVSTAEYHKQRTIKYLMKAMVHYAIYLEHEWSDDEEEDEEEDEDEDEDEDEEDDEEEEDEEEEDDARIC